MDEIKLKSSPTELCPDCRNIKDWRWVEVEDRHSVLKQFCCKVKETEEVSFHMNKYKDPTAFMIEKATNKLVAVDKKGKKFDPHETRYLEHYNDPHGWRATGKVKPKKTYHFM